MSPIVRMNDEFVCRGTVLCCVICLFLFSKCKIMCTNDIHTIQMDSTKIQSTAKLGALAQFFRLTFHCYRIIIAIEIPSKWGSEIFGLSLYPAIFLWFQLCWLLLVECTCTLTRSNIQTYHTLYAHVCNIRRLLFLLVNKQMNHFAHKLTVHRTKFEHETKKVGAKQQQHFGFFFQQQRYKWRSINITGQHFGIRLKGHYTRFS